MSFLGIFPHEVKVIIFAWRGAREVCLKQTLENSELGKTQIPFLGGGECWWMWPGVGVGIRSWGQGVGVWIRSWEQGVRVWIRSWGQGVGVWIRSWGQGVWVWIRS